MSSSNNNLALATGNWRRGSDSNPHNHNISRWHRPANVPRPVNIPPPDPWQLFEERVRTGPFRLTGFPEQPQSPMRILVLEDTEMAQVVNPGLRRFIQESPPRGAIEQWLMPISPQEPESHLTREEQKKALKKLKKEVYISKKKKKWSLYYRDNAINNFKEKDEEEKGCPICLEDFVPNQEVLVTPCNHMFHEECIVPWVKSHGQCPVCRFMLCDRRIGNALSPNNGVENDVLALIRAMEEAFQWINASYR